MKGLSGTESHPMGRRHDMHAIFPTRVRVDPSPYLCLRGQYGRALVPELNSWLSFPKLPFCGVYAKQSYLHSRCCCCCCLLVVFSYCLRGAEGGILHICQNASSHMHRKAVLRLTTGTLNTRLSVQKQQPLNTDDTHFDIISFMIVEYSDTLFSANASKIYYSSTTSA